MFAFNRQSALFNTFTLSLLCLFLMSLTACGFHLRGLVELSKDLSPLYLKTNNAYELARDVTGLLRSNSIELTQPPGEAKVVLMLLNEKRSRRVVAVNSNGRASEYLLTYSVDIQFSGAGLTQNQGGGNTNQKTDTITLNRTLNFDPDTVLAATNEAETLYRDMTRDAARRILLKLQALSVTTK